MKTKMYTYDDLWKLREEFIKKDDPSFKNILKWEKSQKFVKLEDYEKLNKQTNTLKKRLVEQDINYADLLDEFMECKLELKRLRKCNKQ